MALTLVSVNCGVTRIVGQRHCLPVHSAIGKSPVAADSILFARKGICGDEQTNRLLHGGADRAVCAYAATHWRWWNKEKGFDCSEGWFGENLTLFGTNEDDVCIGDQFSWDDIVLEVTRPRGPCANLDLYHGGLDIAQSIVRSGRCGWYLRVIQEGYASTRDPLIRHIRAHGMPTVADAFAARYGWRTPLALRRRAPIPALPTRGA